MTHTDTSTPADRRTGVILLLATGVFWSLNGLFIKWLYAGGLDGWTIAGYRSLFACLCVTPFALRRITRVTEPRWVIATVLAFTGMCATFVISTTQTTAANAIFLQYTAPAWVFLVAPFITGERASKRQYSALVLSLIGVAVIFLWQYAPGQSGLIVALASGFVFGVQTVLFRRVRMTDPLVLTWLVCGGSALLLVPAAHVIAGPRLTLGLLSCLALMGAVQFGLPYVMYSAAMKRVTAQQGVLIILIEPVLNPVWVWLIRNEVPHVSTIVGGACIVAGVLYLSILQLVNSNATRPRE